MFEASVDGEAYDMDRWGQYFKPAGMGQATGDPNKAAAPAARVSAPAPQTSSEEDLPWEDSAPAEAPAPKAAPAPAAGGENASRAQDILAMIRNRQKQ